MKHFCIRQIFICLLTMPLFAQTTVVPTHNKISESLQNYFAMDRENIHLHLNKNTYLTNEKIWFKGYVTEIKGKPTINTSNVYISLYNDQNQKIATQLYYAESNIFEGHVNLDKDLKSGRYFLQAYTNFMNNFSENESAVYEIKILNSADKSYTISEKVNLDDIEISYFPESGTFLEGISNTIGVKIVDCRNQGMAIENIAVFDSKGNVVSKFATDKYGYGKFEIYETKLENYKIAITVAGKNIEKILSLPVPRGISFSMVNYIFPEKTVIKIKTNVNTIQQIKNAVYALVFQQNEATTFVEFSFKNGLTEQLLTVKNSDLAAGINTVFLIDANLAKIGERLIYNPIEKNQKTLFNIAKKRGDSIVVTGSSPILSGNLSISVLPIGTVFQNPEKPIQGSFYFDNYLSSHFMHAEYYLNDFSKKKHFELDNFLLSQHSKYDWEKMLTTPPQKKYESDAGLTIKGTFNNGFKVGKDNLVNMNSLGLGLNEFAHLNDKNEFFFENILAQDSTKLYFVALENKIRKPEVKIYSQILNNNRMFLKSFDVSKGCQTQVSDPNDENRIPFPKVENSIALDSITLFAKKNTLTHRNKRGNMMARGFKISDNDAAIYRDLLNYIRSNGFNVFQQSGNTYIRGYSNSFIASNSDEAQNPQIKGPAVYIDGGYVQNYDILREYSLTSVDEIYINKTGFDITIRGSRGIINIYTKKDNGVFNNNIANKSQALFVKNGFQKFSNYVNTKYDSLRDEGFQKLGTIDWKPIIRTDEHGTFDFAIPNYFQKSVKLVVEGIAPDGTMISEIAILDIP